MALTTEQVTSALRAPLPVVEKDVPYERVMFRMSMAPRTVAKGVEMSLHIVTQPYRVLSDGTVDVGPEHLGETINLASSQDMSADQQALFTNIAASVQKLIDITK